MSRFYDYLKIVNESAAYRIDNEKIDDFSNMKSYYHNDDWTISGMATENQKLEKGFTVSKGLFAGNFLKEIIPYATPRQNGKSTSFIKEGKKIYFLKSDEKKIENYKPYISKFNVNNFKKLSSSGELFSTNPGKVQKQVQIINPLKWMKKLGYEVFFVEDLKILKNELEKNNKKFDYEGL